MAHLFKILVRDFPLMLLIVGTADGLTDIGAFPDPGSIHAKPLNSPDRNAQINDSGTTWAVYNALTLALWTVWPQSELESRLSMTDYSGRNACIAFQTTRARWNQSNEAARAHILATVAAAAARVYGIIRPSTATSTVRIAVRAGDVTQLTASATSAERHDESAYLAETTIGLRSWSPSPSHPA